MGVGALLALAHPVVGLGADRHLRRPSVIRGRQANVQVQLERFGDFLCNKVARRATVNAPDQLAAQEPVGQRVVDAAAAGWPEWRHGGQRIDHPLPVEDVVIGHGHVQPVQPSLVRHHLVHRDVAFPTGSELGPVPGHRDCVIQLAAIGQHGNRQRHHTLAH